MNEYRMPADEMETIIRIGRTDELASVWTDDPIMIRRLDRTVQANPEVVCISKEEYAARYTLPKTSITLGRKKRRLSDEQKAALAERLNKPKKEGEEDEQDM